MQAAAEACFQAITNHFAGDCASKKALILCGLGNNGGDGAALALELHRAGVHTDVVLFGRVEQTRGDAQTNLEIVQRQANIGVGSSAVLTLIECDSAETLGNLTLVSQTYDIVVDALLGTGLSRPVEGVFLQVVEHLASMRAARERLPNLLRPCGNALPELLGKRDDDALGAADVGEPIRVLVLHHFADQFGAVGEQARDDVVDVIDGEHDAADPECVQRSVRGPSSDRLRRVELVQLDPSVAVRSAHQCEGSTDVLKADETIYRGALDGRLALQLESEVEKEGLRGLKVVDDDKDVVHSFKRHVLPSKA